MSISTPTGIRDAWQASMNYDMLEVALPVVYVYHCLITADMEVAYVWSRRVTPGTVVYLLTRYAPFLHVVVSTITLGRTREYFELKTCLLLSNAQLVAQTLVPAFSDLTLAFCIYALLGGGRRYCCLMSLIYSAFYVPIAVLIGLEMMNGGNGTAIPPEDRVRVAMLESPCLFRWPATLERLKIIGYLYIVWSIFIAVLGVAVVVARYRRQSNSLLNCIRRDGAAYNLAACLLRLAYTILVAIAAKERPRLASGRRFSVTGDALLWVDMLLAPVLSTSMLLNMREIDDRCIREIVSALIFAPIADKTESDLCVPEGPDSSIVNTTCTA